MTIPLARLEAARDVVAQHLVSNLIYAPVFARMEAEVARAAAELSADPVTRARHLMEARRTSAA